MFIENLPYPGIGKAEMGEHFAGIIFGLLFPYAGNKNGEQAGKQNDRTHIIYDFCQKNVRPLYFRRKLNARALLEALVPHVTSLRRRFALFSISFVIYCPFLTIKEQYQKIEYFILFLVTKTLKIEMPICLQFVTNVLHIPRQIAFPR